MADEYQGVITYESLIAEQKAFVARNAKNCEDVLPISVFLLMIAKTDPGPNGGMPSKPTLSDRQLDAIRRSYYVSIPEPGSNLGIISSQIILQPRQQSNLNIKHVKSENHGMPSTSGEDESSMCPLPIDWYSNDNFRHVIKNFTHKIQTPCCCLTRQCYMLCTCQCL